MYSNFEDINSDWIYNDLVATNVANPTPDSDNNSAQCLELKLSGGAYPLMKLDLDSAFDFTTLPYFRIKVNGANDRGIIMLKFENADNSESYYKTAFVHGKGENGWEDLTFDMSQAPSEKFTRMVIFIDLADYNGTENDIWYIDEIERFGIQNDTESPSTPLGLSVTNLESNHATLSWNKSQDNSQIENYKVYIDNTLFTITTTNSVLLYDLEPETLNSVTVQAVDMAGNISNQSSPLSFTTKSNSVSAIPANFNYIFGTQTFKPDYQFTDANSLTETAEGIIAMGSNILKISLQPSSYIEPDPGYKAPMDAINNYPFIKQAIDQEQFKYIFLWVYSPNTWVRDDGMQQYELDSETNTIYELTQYLLETYKGSGKTFFIGNWEADWELVNDASGNEDWNALKPTVDAHRITGMIDQLNRRQAAIDKAKAETIHNNVDVFHYTEVNLPKARSLDQGLPSMLTDVLPHVNVDFVSYSCYDTTRNFSDEATISQNLKTVMDALENALPAKSGLPFAKRVFIGEFGFPNGREDKYNTAYAEPQNQEDQDEWSRYVMKTAIEWGCPFALYWTFYGNEHKTVDGIDWNTQNGYWMINSRNDKQKIYYTYQNYYAQAKQGILDFMAVNNNTLPNEEEFKTIALKALDTAKNTAVDPTLSLTYIEDTYLQTKIFPNPTTDVIYINNADLSIKSVQLFDLKGEFILESKSTYQGVLQLDMTTVSKGIYAVVITYLDGKQETQKVVKN